MSGEARGGYKEWGNMVCFGNPIVVSGSVFYNILCCIVESFSLIRGHRHGWPNHVKTSCTICVIVLSLCSWTNIVGIKVHTPARVVQAVGEETLVDGTWMRISLRCFDKTWRSPPCTLDGMVGVGKWLLWKSRRRWGFSDDDTVDRKALRDGKGDRNETWSLKSFL